MHPSLTDEDQIIFFSEIETLSVIKNPAVLGLVGFNLQNFSKESYPTIITEYMPNDSLRKILESEQHSLAPHDWTITKKYINLLGISLGMQYLHQKNIVHRDLKPENILLDEYFYPHICDFGFSKLLDGKLSQNLMKSGVGTSLYMAPEILLEKEYNFNVDIYSFSLIAYEINTGQDPTVEGNFLTFMNNVTKGKRPDLSIIRNKKIQKFLEKCWSNDPNERPTFQEIVETLCNPDFYSSFEFDVDEVIDYVNLFPSDHPVLKKIS